MKIGIIGCGLIGNKRQMSFDKEDQVLMVCDVNQDSAQALAQKCRCTSTQHWQDVVSHPEIEAVVIATVHQLLSEITKEALRHGKHVLVEKPAARNAEDLKPTLETYKSLPADQHLVAKVGFNHRFHPAMLKAKELIDAGAVGELMFIRGRYGHGGRIGYDKEWRAEPEVSGGGELLDQGMHLIDLSRWYMGDFEKSHGVIQTYFWDMPVEDNAFMTLETAQKQVAQLHVTWTEWKNLFSLEIYGQTGKLHIEGLGGSYGTERLAYYKMLPEMGPPETTIYEYPGADKSWKAEWQNFKEAVAQKTKPLGDLEDAYQALSVVRSIYQMNQTAY